MINYNFIYKRIFKQLIVKCSHFQTVIINITFFPSFPTEWYNSEAFLKPSFDIRGTNRHTLLRTLQPDTDRFVNKHSAFSNADPPMTINLYRPFLSSLRGLEVPGKLVSPLVEDKSRYIFENNMVFNIFSQVKIPKAEKNSYNMNLYEMRNFESYSKVSIAEP